MGVGVVVGVGVGVVVVVVVSAAEVAATEVTAMLWVLGATSWEPPD